MTPEQVFLKLVHGVADRDFAVLPELYAEQTDVRHPMNPYGDHPLLSRDALREHFGGVGPRVTEVVRFQPDNIRVHETTDPEVVIAEYDYAGLVTTTQQHFTVANIQVFRIGDGLIVASRDYHDHARLASALSNSFAGGDAAR